MRLTRNNKNDRQAAFSFQSFSRKQMMLLNWWRDGSPHKDKPMVIADGAIRSGKTIAMICSFFEWSLNTFENRNFIVAGRSMGALKRNVIEPTLQIISTWGVTFYYNRSENFLVIGNNTYYLFGASNEASQDVLQGLTAAGAYADEIALFPRSFVEQMIGRCSVDGSKIFVNCNPDGPFHWFKLEYVDKAEEKGIYYIHFTMDDNLTLSDEKRHEYAVMFTGIFYLRYILGLWALAEGAVYSVFDPAKHLVDSVPVQEWTDKLTNEHKTNVKRRFVGIDYGQNNPTAFVLLCELTDGRIYIERERRAKTITNATKVQELLKFIGDTEINGVIVDPSALAFIDQIKLDTTLRVMGANNDVLDGISTVATFIEQGRLFVCARCENVRKEIQSYVWDSKAQEVGEDRPIKQNDHFLDAIRYVIFTVFGKVSKVRVHSKYTAGMR